MKGFVASWFFPPQTSAEGIVTYKLLKYSAHEYDVCCSASDLWSYHTVSEMTSDNIHVFPVQTDDIEHWVEEAFSLFVQRHEAAPYDFIMTRSMPPESVLFGFKVKEKYPDLRWIASFADPIARNPYELAAYVKEADLLKKEEKSYFLDDLANGYLDAWKERKAPAIQLLCKLNEWESKALALADHYIFPSADQANYTLKNARTPKAWIIPHSFDPETIPQREQTSEDRVTVTYCGFSDNRRSLAPVVKAMNILQLRRTDSFNRLRIRVVGNTPREILDMVQNFHLEDSFSFEKGVDYATSLKIMAESDWLLHLEAFFDDLEGGSIFFASKLAEYFGTCRPILGLCTPYSTAGKMIRRAGGKVIPQWETNELADFLDSLARGEYDTQMDADYCGSFSSVKVAEYYDRQLETPLTAESFLDAKNREWPVRQSEDGKLVTVCVPSYIAELLLDRCLLSLVTPENAGKLEILVVNDGSKDHTAEIGALYEARYPGIVRLISKENGGHGSTINTALEEAAGKYFMVVDADDWVNSAALEDLIRKMTEENLDEDLILTHYYKVDESTGRFKESLMQAEIPFDTPFRFEEVNVKGMYIALANSLFKLSVLRESGVRLQEHTFYVDVEYILFPIPYIETIRYLDYSLYRYSVGNVNQSISQASMVKRYEHHDRVMRRVTSFYAGLDTTKEKKEYIHTILALILTTHYNVGLHDDWNRKRGYARAKDFNRFLKKTSRRLYRDTAKTVKKLRFARLTNFHYFKTAREYFAVAAHAVIHSRLAHILVHSPLIRLKPFKKLVEFVARKKAERQ